MAFVGSSSTFIAGDVVNIVHGDQVNSTVVARKTRKKIKAEATLYDEFRNIRLGDIYRTREVGQRTVRLIIQKSTLTCLEVEQSVSIAKVQDTDTSSKYTVVSYRGPNAHMAWNLEFRKLTLAQDASFTQLFGINRSQVPSLLFYGELVPLANAVQKFVPFIWTSLAICAWGPNVYSMWLDTNDGRICDGPTHSKHIKFEDQTFFRRNYATPPPRSAEFLKDDVAFRFYSTLDCNPRQDNLLLQHLEDRRRSPEKVESFSPLGGSHEGDFLLQPFVIYTPSLVPIAMIPSEEISFSQGGARTWKAIDHGALRWTEKVSEAEYTRFQLTDRGYQMLLSGGILQLYCHLWFRMSCRTFARAWIAQSSTIFTQLGLSDAERQECFFICCCYGFHGRFSGFCRIHLQNSDADAASNRQVPTPDFDKPVYLLVPRPPQILCTTDFPKKMKDWTTNFPAYWSFDVGPMEEAERERLNLPQPVLEVSAPQRNYWKNNVYDAAARYQKVKGYGYKDFAEILKLPALQFVNGSCNSALKPSLTVVEERRVSYTSRLR